MPATLIDVTFNPAELKGKKGRLGVMSISSLTGSNVPELQKKIERILKIAPPPLIRGGATRKSCCGI
jgi:hypothetical protein